MVDAIRDGDIVAFLNDNPQYTIADVEKWNKWKTMISPIDKWIMDKFNFDRPLGRPSKD